MLVFQKKEQNKACRGYQEKLYYLETQNVFVRQLCKLLVSLSTRYVKDHEINCHRDQEETAKYCSYGSSDFDDLCKLFHWCLC